MASMPVIGKPLSSADQMTGEPPLSSAPNVTDDGRFAPPARSAGSSRRPTVTFQGRTALVASQQRKMSMVDIAGAASGGSAGSGGLGLVQGRPSVESQPQDGELEKPLILLYPRKSVIAQPSNPSFRDIVMLPGAMSRSASAVRDSPVGSIIAKSNGSLASPLRMSVFNLTNRAAGTSSSASLGAAHSAHVSTARLSTSRLPEADTSISSLLSSPSRPTLLPGSIPTTSLGTSLTFPHQISEEEDDKHLSSLRESLELLRDESRDSAPARLSIARLSQSRPSYTSNWS
ncbi:hypothetical protein HK097_006631, partial [Rhizophlyctis rosea]